MSAALQRTPRMGVADFIEMIRLYPDEERWELLDGVPVLMAPQSDRHQRIVTNFLRMLDRLARPRGCWAVPGLGLLNDEADGYAPIPDVVLRCGPQLDGGYARDPVLLAEVLSPSTMNNDRGRKIDFYRTIPTLRTILIAYQDEIRIEAWQREGADRQRESAEWRRTVLTDRAAALHLPELDGALSLDEIYEDIAFG